MEWMTQINYVAIHSGNYNLASLVSNNVISAGASIDLGGDALRSDKNFWHAEDSFSSGNGQSLMERRQMTVYLPGHESPRPILDF
jgi:hypothetical protein